MKYYQRSYSMDVKKKLKDALITNLLPSHMITKFY